LRKIAILMVAGTALGCDPELTVGSWPCTSSTGPVGRAPDGSITSVKDPIQAPWQNGFEDGFCGYARAKGFCYQDPLASYALVDAPVHSGLRAARFSVTADDRDALQTRCVREGTLPVDAVYGAWFYLAGTAAVRGNWNLMYFNGGPPDDLPGQWDVSIGDGDAGPLTLHLLNHLNNGEIIPDLTPEDGGVAPVVPSVPVGEWFHVEFRYRRAKDATGIVALYQDGTLITQSRDIKTEGSSVMWGQWYVGNLADGVTPPDSTLYVDDVSIALPP
jgi:hypothetical protein